MIVHSLRFRIAKPVMSFDIRFMLHALRLKLLACVGFVCVSASSVLLKLSLGPLARLRSELDRSQRPVLSVVCSSAVFLSMRPRLNPL